MTREPCRRAHHRGDARDVPERRRGIREEEPPVGIEDAEAPRRDDHEAGHREQDADEDRRELAPRSIESLRDDRRDRRGERDANYGQDAACEQQQPEDRAG